MIKIVKGIYGYWNGHMVTPKTEKDGPFSETPEQEERLVNLGIAVYVDETPELASINSEDASTVMLEDMTLKELKAFAEPYGVKYKVGTSKGEFIKAIKQAMNDLPNAELEMIEDVEEPPEFDATEAVL